MLLTTLSGIAADASALPGPPPAALPTLRELLARLKSEPAPTARPSAGSGLRTRLAASATAPAAPWRGGLDRICGQMSPPFDERDTEG